MITYIKRINKLIISFLFLLFCFLLLIMCSCSSSNNIKQANHDQETPAWLANYSGDKNFDISNIQQLKEFSNFVNGAYETQGNFEGKTVTLKNDIILNENSKAEIGGMNDADEFWSIGDTSKTGDEWFAGEFDGCGHKISGLYSTTSSQANTLGFFAGITGNAKIHDVSFENSWFESLDEKVPVSIIPCIKENGSTQNIQLYNIYIAKDVFTYGMKNAAGILADVRGSGTSVINVANCAFEGNTKSTYKSTTKDKDGKVKSSSNTGGIVSNAENANISIKNCLSTGVITGGTNSSGILGNADGPVSISNSVDIAELRSASSKFGYRLYGGSTNIEVNNNLNICNNIALIANDHGEIKNLAGINDNTIIKDVNNLYSSTDIGIIKCLEGWTQRNNLQTKSDIPIPQGLQKFAPYSKFALDIVSVDENVGVNIEADSSVFFKIKFLKSYVDNLRKNNKNSVIKFGILEGDTVQEDNSASAEVTQQNLVREGNYYTQCFQYKDIPKEEYKTIHDVNGFLQIDDKYIYGENIVSTSLSQAAWKELSDVRSAPTGNYINKIEDEYFTNEYSPYNNKIRQMLISYLDDKPLNNASSEYATPEEVGLSSQEILNMFQDMKNRKLATHTTMIMRHGKIVTEKYADGYDENTLQRMYSVSKTITGISMGILLNDKNYDVKIEDPVGKYFPEYSDCDPVIYNTTIKQCLTMSTPFNHGVYQVGDKKNNDWVKSFFTTPKDKDPNSNEFWYDTCGCHLCGSIIERVTGKDLITYAREKAFSKTGMKDNTWCVKSPEGYCWGGSGCMITTRDFLNIGNLMLCGGQYKGEQILNAQYVKDSTTSWIDDSPEGYSCNDGRGYGYFIWLTDYGYAFEGMGNQLCVCMPDKDMVFVCTSDNQGYSNGYHDLFDLVYRHLYKNSYAGSLPANNSANKKLQDFKLTLPVQAGNNSSSISNNVNNKLFSGGTESKITNFSFDFNQGKLTYTCHGEDNKVINFGIGSNKFGNLNETSYCWKQLNIPMTENGREDGYRTAASGAWQDDRTFVLYLQVIDDYLANMKMTFKFDEDGKSCILSNVYTAEGFLSEYKMTNAKFEQKGD